MKNRKHESFDHGGHEGHGGLSFALPIVRRQPAVFEIYFERARPRSATVFSVTFVVPIPGIP